MARLEWSNVRVPRRLLLVLRKQYCLKSSASEDCGIEWIGTGLRKEGKNDPSCGRRILQPVTVPGNTRKLRAAQKA